MGNRGLSNFNSRFEAAAEVWPALRPAVERHGNRQIPDCIAGYIAASDVGPLIAYHLAIYPAFALSLVGIPLVDALFAIENYAQVLSVISAPDIGDSQREALHFRLAALRAPQDVVRLVASQDSVSPQTLNSLLEP